MTNAGQKTCLTDTDAYIFVVENVFERRLICADLESHSKDDDHMDHSENGDHQGLGCNNVNPMLQSRHLRLRQKLL